MAEESLVLREIEHIFKALLKDSVLKDLLQRLVKAVQCCFGVERVLFVFSGGEQDENYTVPDCPEGRQLIEAVPLLRLATERARSTSDRDEICKTLKIGSIISYPLMFDNRLCGAMLIGTSSGSLDSKDMKLLELFALQASLAIELHQMHKKTERIQTQLFSSAEVLTLGQMVSGVAHELSNYLTVVWERTQLLLPRIRAKDVPGALQTLEIISEYLGKMKRFTDGLMNIYAFSQQGLKSHLDLNDLITNLVEFINPQTKFREIEFVSQLATDLPAVEVNPDRIQGMLLNLYTNAAETMRKGRITTKTEYDRTQDEIRITVSDNGPGIPEQIQKKVFAPGFTTKKGGHGLGLSLCRQIAREHGGDIKLNSRPGEGTIFTISLPVRTCERHPRKDLTHS